MNNFEFDFQRHRNVTIANIDLLIFDIYDDIFRNNNIIVNKHIDFQIFD